MTMDNDSSTITASMGEYPPAVLHRIEHLSYLGRRLSRLSSLVLVETCCNIAVLFLALIMPVLQSRFFWPFVIPNGLIVAFIAIPISIATLISLRQFEVVRERGRVLFEEISDELHWGKERTYSAMEMYNRPGLELRVLLREFSLNEKLPFAPRGSGEAIYAISNLILPILAVVISISFPPYELR